MRGERHIRTSEVQHLRGRNQVIKNSRANEPGRARTYIRNLVGSHTGFQTCRLGMCEFDPRRVNRARLEEAVGSLAKLMSPRRLAIDVDLRCHSPV